MRFSLAVLVMEVAIVANAVACFNAWAGSGKEDTSRSGTNQLSPGMVSSTKGQNTPSYNQNALHRLDFTVKGKSCAVCLFKIQKKVQQLPGVVKVAVMMKKPFGAVILYDSSKLTPESIFSDARGTDKDVKFENVQDKPIKRIPTMLVPVNWQPPENNVVLK